MDNLANQKKGSFWPRLASLCHEILLFEPTKLSSWKERASTNKIVDSTFKNKVQLNRQPWAKLSVNQAWNVRTQPPMEPVPELVWPLWWERCLSCKWIWSFVFLIFLGSYSGFLSEPWTLFIPNTHTEKYESVRRRTWQGPRHLLWFSC